VRHLWLTAEQISEVTGWSERTLRAKAAAGEIQFREVEGARGRGRKPREYSAASLPAEFHSKLLAFELAGASSTSLQLSTTAGLGPDGARATSPAEASGQGALFPETSALPGRAFEALTPEQQKTARERAKIIEPMLDWAGGRRWTMKLGSGSIVATMDDLARWLGEQHATSPRTLWSWYARFKKDGLAALADRARSDKGTSKFFAQYPDARAFVENKFLNERISIQSSWEALTREWPRLYNHGSRPPSYETVRAYLAALPEPVVSLARRGEKDFNENHRPFILRDYRTARVNDMWVSDHMQHDVFVYNDLGLAFGAQPMAAFRPYLTDFMDIRSRKITGFVWSVNPSSESICSALRLGICRFGAPRELYTDNGKDYKSEHLQAVLARLGIGTKFATKYHAQAKPNESWHRTLHARLDQKLQPAYCGPTHDRRPEECSLALREHEAFLARKQKYTPLMAASEFFRLAALWIEQNYNAEHAHRGHAMDRRTPNDVFDEGCPPASRRPIDPREIAELFWKRERRKLREAGCVVIDNRRYEPSDAASFAALNTLAAGEREVMIACDPLNVAEAVVFAGSGEFLGMLRCMELAAWGQVSAAEIRANKKLQADYTKAIGHYRERIAYQRAVAGDLPERDVLRAAAGLAVGSRVVTPEDPMFHAEQSSPDGARGAEQFVSRRRALAAGAEDQPTYTADTAEKLRRLINEGGE
jgi:putative transposase